MINKKKTLKTERGSIYYLAPEMIKKNYNHKVDIWSAGVIFYILVTGSPPFNATTKNGIDSAKIKDLILKGKVDYKNEKFNKYDPGVKELIQLMLTYDPEERPNAKNLLTHPWFKKTETKISNKPKGRN
jgi:calcium-dependent protein kinase